MEGAETPFLLRLEVLVSGKSKSEEAVRPFTLELDISEIKS